MKFEPIQVTITIKPDDLYDIAQMVVDDLEESFGCEVVEAAGVDQQELFDAVMLDSTFRSMIVDKIKEYGADVIAEPWDYFSGYDFLDTIPGLVRIVDLCREMDQRFQEADEQAVTSISVPEGYILVRV